MIDTLKGVELLMKKKIARLLALGMSIALVFSLAACGGDAETGNTTTDPEAISSAIGGETSAESVPGETGADPAAPGAEDPTQAPGSGTGGDSTTVTVPTNTAGVISLFNSAVDKIASASAKYDRAIAKSGGSISAMGADVIKFDANGNENARWNYTVLSGNFDRTGASLAADKTAFSKLDSGSVSGATATDNGSTITLNISLKDTTVNQSSDQNGKTTGFGQGGYMYFINFEETDSIVRNVVGGPKYNGDTKQGGFDLPGSGTVRLKSGTFSLSGGKMTAIIDKASGKLTSATLSFSENIQGEASYLSLPASANISGSGTIYYSFS